MTEKSFKRITKALLPLGFSLALFLGGCSQTDLSTGFGAFAPRPQSLAQAPAGTMASLPNGFQQQGFYGSAKIGMILPLSGRLAAVGNAMRNAALMAQSDSNAPDMVIDFYDSQSSEGGAAQAVSNAISKGSNLILGPLMGNSIPTVASIANSSGVNVVSFSNDMSQARPGAYVMGVAPATTVPRILRYAAQQGKTRIAVLAPNEIYGMTAGQIVDQTAFQYGLQIVESQYYDPTNQGADSRRDSVKTLAQRNGQFDAVLIPDGGLRLREVTSLLHFHKVDPRTTKFIGTRLWDDANLTKEASLTGGWFSSTPDGQWREFSSKYQRQFGTQPPRPAALAYDAVRMASTLASNGYGFSDGAITQPSGFVGIEGAFRFLPGGTNERQLEIKELTKNGIVVREAAANGFGDATGF